MKITLLNETVDIRICPAVDSLYANQPGLRITVGDLHANALKLLYILVRHGIMTLSSRASLQKSRYTTIAELYQKPLSQLGPHEIQLFNEVLDHATFDLSVALTLIGDVVADRGSNDYFTLKILNKLTEHSVNFENIFSNHDADFIDYCENRPGIILADQTVSLSALQQWIENDWIAQSEITHLVQHSYQPALKLLAYECDPDQHQFHLKSHAPIGMELIEPLVKKLGISWQDNSDASPWALAALIDKVNAAFALHIKRGSLHTQRHYTPYPVPQTDPIEFVIWNRSYQGLIRDPIYKGTTMIYTHGHDSGETSIVPYIYNLDNTLGKGPHYSGLYSVLCSQKVS